MQKIIQNKKRQEDMSVIQRDLKTIKGDRIPIKQVDIIILILRI